MTPPSQPTIGDRLVAFIYRQARTVNHEDDFTRLVARTAGSAFGHGFRDAMMGLDEQRRYKTGFQDYYVLGYGYAKRVLKEALE